MDDPLIGRFEAERQRLRAIATRLVGASDADDVIQESWLRLQRVGADQIENLPAWLTTVVSRISLDRLRRPASAIARGRSNPGATNLSRGRGARLSSLLRAIRSALRSTW